jgi:hypothetical protein
VLNDVKSEKEERAVGGKSVDIGANSLPCSTRVLPTDAVNFSAHSKPKIEREIADIGRPIICVVSLPSS